MSAFTPRNLLVALIAILALSATPAHAASKPFGFNSALNVLNLPAAQPASQMSGAGATTARIGIHWSWVEPARDSYSWSGIDAAYDADLARGIKPLLQIYGSPKWTWGGVAQTCASFPQCNFPPARTSDADWQDLLKVMTRRYPQAIAIEIWNEPNLAWAWEGAPDAVRYTELLKLGYDAIKSVNSAMPVLGASLAPVVSDNVNASGAGVRPFLQTMYDNGAKGKMNGIAVHPYPYDIDFAHSFKTMSLVKETRTANGDTSPLWLTEYGLSTSGPDAFSDLQQAIVLPALTAAFRADSEVSAMYVHTLIEASGDPLTSPEPGHGIIRRDLSLKPAYCSLAIGNGVATSCTNTTPNATQRANWDAQILLQAASDAARKVHVAKGRYLGITAKDLNAVDSRINATKVVGDLLPGPTADPAKIAVYPATDGTDGLMLCNATKAARSYCINSTWRGEWTYGTAQGSVYAAAGATANGGSTTW
jgi:hypothetical protein